MLNRKITPEVISGLMTLHSLTRSQLADLMPMPKRTLEGWLSGRYVIPAYIGRALRDLDRELWAQKENHANHEISVDSNT